MMIIEKFSNLSTRLWRKAKANLIALMVGFALIIAILVVFMPVVVVQIPVGFNGVIYRPLSNGVDMSKLYKEGVHLKFPWNTITLYNMQIQHDSMDIEVLTSDLLKTNIQVSFQYALDWQTLPLLHQYVGKDYLKKIILPKVSTATRENIAKYTSSQAFTSDFQKVMDQITVYVDDSVIDKLSPPGLTNVRLLTIKDIQITEITFPKTYEEAIDAKLVEKALADSYVYKIEAASLEAKRKVIEAEGIRKFQEIVNAGLTDNFLRFKGIEATKELAGSSNSKIVMFGQGSSGLPLIMGDVDKAGSKSK